LELSNHIYFYHNTLCAEAGWLQEEGIITLTNYTSLVKRGWLIRIRRAAPNSPALVDYNSIPDRFKEIIKERYGDPTESVKPSQFKDYITLDAEASTYYSRYRLPDGRALPPETQTEYINNASILNSIHTLVTRRTTKRRSLGASKVNIWDAIAEQVEIIRSDYKHTLPGNTRRLRDKYKQYKTDGYDSLIHKGFGNDNRRLVNEQIEALFMAIAAMPNKPFSSTVYDEYIKFMTGQIDIVDLNTGELFNRENFYDENNNPILVSESTVWNYLSNPKNKAAVSKVRSSSLEYNSTHRPHHLRHAPYYSMSKVSLDDRDLPRKLKDGTRVKAYYAYDVASRTCIGVAYNRYKTTELFIDCLRNMFRFLNNNGIGLPMEVEVEHHIVNQFKDDLFKADVVFPFVRWCNPGNSQEKRAEHLNREKKYGFEKRYQDGIGRFYSKLEANRPKVDKISDASNDNYNDKTYSFDQLVADDLEVIRNFNFSQHPDRELYPGMSRMEVLINNQNPDVREINQAQLAFFIGEKTSTSIRRSKFMKVQYAWYKLPSPELIGKLAPNNLTVDAYYIPDDDGTIDKLYIYQNNNFICEAEKEVSYNEATAEQTETDRNAFTEQSKYVASYDKMIKDHKPKKVAIIERTEIETPEVVDVIETELPDSNSDFDFDYDADYYAQLGRETL